jgi:tRNA(Ile)-lysidine synthase
MKNVDFTNIKCEKKIAVAISGGIDSTALALLTNEFAKKHQIQLIALTVDHKLRKSSTEEANFVQNLMKKYGIEHYILTWEGGRKDSNIEFEARQARYHLLTNFCKKHKIKYLLVGHHKQDQAENFLIRLFRGSGIDGLASMRNENEINGVKILRPLLDVSKEELGSYLVKHKVEWVEDESNEDEKFLRNKIRKFLDSFGDEKINIVNRINNTVDTMATARDIIEKELKKKSKKIIQRTSDGCIRINMREFKKLDQELGLRLLAWVLMEISGNTYKPRLKQLQELYNVIISSEEIKGRTLYGCIVKSASCMSRNEIAQKKCSDMCTKDKYEEFVFVCREK